jgi:eukaryotic-like serine/threonine-protein kinase
MIGKSIAQYRIVEELGRGGMGMVYKAHDTQLDRPVVLKLLMSERLADEESRRRFLREARLASALDHPNICTIYEIQETGGYFFIAMQFVEGETLKEAIDSRPLPLQTVISVALQIADAMAAAHSRGIIHRDIKPQNIMLTPRGQAKILDFGLAKSLDEADSSHGTDLTEMGSPLGTPSYMSPEQIEGERVDRRSDIFSFGIVLFEMVTGRKPFVEKNRIDLLHAICRDPAPEVARFTPSSPGQLQGIIDHAMAKHPADRYQTTDELLADLKRLASAANASPDIPDGIARPYVPVVRDPWWRRALQRASGRIRGEAGPQTTGISGPASPRRSRSTTSPSSRARTRRSP